MPLPSRITDAVKVAASRPCNVAMMAALNKYLIAHDLDISAVGVEKDARNDRMTVRGIVCTTPEQVTAALNGGSK